MILREYNRLTASNIPLEEFVHWVQKGPAGPAWHALLQTEEGRVVGHTSLIPLCTAYGGPQFIPAKSEYSFTHEDFRSTPIRNFETVKRAKFLILVDQLFLHGLEQGWGPYFVSTATANHPLSRRVGCRPVEFPLWECLLILRPFKAASHTQNVSRQQRVVLLAAGSAQRAAWSAASRIFRHSNGLRSLAVASQEIIPNSNRIALFEDADSLKWRYLEGQYVALGLDGTPGEYLIVKRGSEERYLRVCQWHLTSASSLRSILFALVRLAKNDRAIGIRWAVYDENEGAAELAARLRALGFIRARRIRTMMVHAKSPEFLTPSKWKINDSFFSFDP